MRKSAVESPAQVPGDPAGGPEVQLRFARPRSSQRWYLAGLGVVILHYLVMVPLMLGVGSGFLEALGVVSTLAVPILAAVVAEHSTATEVRLRGDAITVVTRGGAEAQLSLAATDVVKPVWMRLLLGGGLVLVDRPSGRRHRVSHRTDDYHELFRRIGPHS